MRKHIIISIFAILLPALVFSQQQIESPGFEIWEDAGTVLYEPENWSSIKTSDEPGLSLAAPVVWGQSDDAHSGNYSVYLFNVYVTLIESTAAGTLTNGRIHASIIPAEGYAFTQADDPRWNTPFQSRPDSLAGWFKYNPVEGDTAGIRAILHIDEAKIPPNGTEVNWIADANHQFPGHVVDTWTRFSVPFEYLSNGTPEYLLIVIKAGNGLQAIEGSELLVDDLQMIYNDPGGIDDPLNSNTWLYYQNNGFNIKLNNIKNAQFYLMDMNGKVVFNRDVTGNRIELNVPITDGIYIGKIVANTGVYTGKVYIY